MQSLIKIGYRKKMLSGIEIFKFFVSDHLNSGALDMTSSSICDPLKVFLNC